MTASPTDASPRTALRQGLLVTCAVAALFTAMSTSLESQRTVARLTPSSATAPAEYRSAALIESCSPR
jgi:hypothetical protein